MTTASASTAPALHRNLALTATRIFAGLLGTMQLAGVVYFVLLAPEQAVWVGAWVDIPITALLLGGVLVKLAVAVAPALDVHRRIGLGLTAVAIGIAVTLVKIPVYDEPEGALFLAFDGVLLGLLLLARRGAAPRR